MKRARERTTTMLSTDEEQAKHIPDEAGIPADRPGFTALFRSLYPDLCWYARRLTHDAATAEDLVQEAFARVWVRRATLDPERSVRALLYVTLRHLAMNHHRDDAARRTLLGRVDIPAPAPDPEETTRSRLLGRRLLAWIDEMPDRQREAFELSRYCGLSHAEIAAVMTLSVHTVEKHVTNALRHLRDRLRAYDPDLLKS